MKTYEIKIDSLEQLPQAAERFVELLDQGTVVAFKGDMGAGKTTFIRQLAETLGVDPEEANSPSFSIINEYRSDTTAELIYHFDLYRLDSLEEAFEIGVEDYLDSGALCLIEWPDRIEDILPEDTVRVEIAEQPDGTRLLTMQVPDFE